MAEEMKGTNISSPVVPFTKDDKYATHDETFGRGGYRSVNSISEMNAIPSERRKEGMLVNVIGDKIYKLVNGSFTDAGLNGSGGSGSGEVYFTSLGIFSIVDGSSLTQAQYDELRVIFNKWISGVPIFYSDNYNKIEITCWANNANIEKVTYFGISCTNNLREYTCTVDPNKVGNRWRCRTLMSVIAIDLYDIYLEDGYSALVAIGDNDILFDELKKLYDYGSSNIPIQIVGLNGESGIFNINGSSVFYRYYIKYYQDEYELVLDYIDTSTFKYTLIKTSKNDLSIEVKTASDGIYYRIKERVPNGYIQFVRKKRHKYYPSGIGQVNRTGYSVLGLDFNHNSVGVSAMETTPNVWYKFPITKERLYSKYTQGSIIENLSGGHVRNYNTIRLCGNTHAKPIKYGDNGTVYNLRKTSVLHAGLQYNVLHPDYVNKVSPKVIFKQRGEIVPIDVRMNVDPKSFNLDPVLYFAVQ